MWLEGLPRAVDAAEQLRCEQMIADRCDALGKGPEFRDAGRVVGITERQYIPRRDGHDRPMRRELRQRLVPELVEQDEAGLKLAVQLQAMDGAVPEQLQLSLGQPAQVGQPEIEQATGVGLDRIGMLVLDIDEAIPFVDQIARSSGRCPAGQ